MTRPAADHAVVYTFGVASTQGPVIRPYDGRGGEKPLFATQE